MITVTRMIQHSSELNDFDDSNDVISCDACTFTFGFGKIMHQVQINFIENIVTIIVDGNIWL